MVNEGGGGDQIGHSNQRCANGSGGARNTDTYAQFNPTPGEENVCAYEPIDADGDGIPDDEDNCPNTAFGEIVNNFGCSISDLCPCDNDWKNHGGYVKCVAHTSEDFLVDGLITETEKDIIVSDAAGSNCGQKK